MDKSEDLEKDRLVRLRSINKILGEPDLLTITKVSSVNSFLSHKKIIEKDEHFVFGLNFPTTAHFSSFITNKISNENKNNKSDTQFKIKMHVFDVFRRIDFHIEILIPGSMQIKAFNLNGQPINTNNLDYDFVYFSSVLRSLYPHSYHYNTKIYGDVEKYQILSNFICNFVPFSIKNALPNIEDFVQIENLGIEIVINYLKQNSLWNLSEVILNQLKKHLPKRASILSLQLNQMKQMHKQIIVECASILLKGDLSPEYKRQIMQFQARALCKCKKQVQAKTIGEIAFKQGLAELETWQEMIKLYLQTEDQRSFFKTLNTALSLTGDESPLKQTLDYWIIPKKIGPNWRQSPLKNKQISNYPEYLFNFDNKYVQSETRFKQLHQILDRHQKQKPTSDLLHRLNSSIAQESFYQKFVTLYEKQKGWKKLLEKRSEYFWLENDFNMYATAIKKKNLDMSYRFINQSLTDTHKTEQNQKFEQKVLNLSDDEQQQNENEEPSSHMNESFQGEFSDTQSEKQKQIVSIAPCSKRIATKRVNPKLEIKKIQVTKVLCNYNLQKLFILTYNNLKLQMDLQKWTQKLNMLTLPQMSKQKTQILGYVFLKKGFFNKQMLKFRKSQQAFKAARKCSNSIQISLVSCYNLAKLYMQHNNIKGVQYYTIEVVKLLYAIGIEKFNVVPSWAKQIIPYIIKHHGKHLIKSLDGPLKEIVLLWMKIDNKSA